MSFYVLVSTHTYQIVQRIEKWYCKSWGMWTTYDNETGFTQWSTS